MENLSFLGVPILNHIGLNIFISKVIFVAIT